MDIVALLAAFADPVKIFELSLAEKMVAGLVTTLLGMGVTFVALMVLQLVIVLMGKLGGDLRDASEVRRDTMRVGAERVSPETVAAITTALAVVLQVSPQDLVIREIRKVGVAPSAWSRAGIGEQMRDDR